MMLNALDKLECKSDNTGVRFGVMSTLGQRLLNHLIPRFFANRHDMHLKTKIAYSTIDHWHNRKKDPTLDAINRISETIHVPMFEILISVYEPGFKSTLRDHPQWETIVNAAKQKYTNKLPDWVFDLVATTSPPRLPKTLSVDYVGDLAKFWLEHGRP